MLIQVSGKWYSVNKVDGFDDTGQHAERTCGNCKSIKYSGIDTAALRFGSCDNYKHSGRLRVKPTAEPCEFWRPRSPAKMVNERVTAELYQEKLGGLKRR